MQVRYNVILRETAEVPTVIFAELRVTLISDSDACLTNVNCFEEEASPRLLKTDSLLILDWRHARDGFEVLVKRRWTHTHVMSQFPDHETLRRMPLYPCSRLGNAVGRTAVPADLQQPGA